MNTIPSEIIMMIIIYFIENPKNILNFKLISKKMNDIFMSMLKNYSINLYSYEEYSEVFCLYTNVYMRDSIKIEKKNIFDYKSNSDFMDYFCYIDTHNIYRGLNLNLNIPIIKTYLSLINCEIHVGGVIDIIDSFYDKIFKYFEIHNIKINFNTKEDKLTIIYENKHIYIKIIVKSPRNEIMSVFFCDLKRSQSLFLKGIELGNGELAHILGDIYGNDEVFKDIKKSVEYYLKGIELGNGESSHNLGDIYENNDECKQKIIECEFIDKHVNKIKTNKHIDKIKIDKHKQKIIRDKSKTDPMDKFRKKKFNFNYKRKL